MSKSSKLPDVEPNEEFHDAIEIGDEHEEPENEAEPQDELAEVTVNNEETSATVKNSDARVCIYLHVFCHLPLLSSHL